MTSTSSSSRAAKSRVTETDLNVTDEATPGYSSTPSGLKYRIVREGDGSKPGPQDEVTVHYRGTLEDGTEFDSSYKRGQTISFPLGGVIPGWTEGLQLIGEGGEIELIIPSELGYGAAGSPPVIPPNATLHFRVELFKVN
ncbi:FKBP-type peptidyl-prolyl cis-trans isomerase [Gimesia fumaroli]|nr:FKBP-type peptidyl-prolyl cis-trans isomerase [Gimesia fumaroli]